MSEIRELRQDIGLSQQQCAALLDVSVDTFRRWDSGRRPVPLGTLHRARRTLGEYEHRTELLPLGQLAADLGVHVRTLQAAARTGRLDATFYERSVFGRPRRVASRAASEKFMWIHYRRFAGQPACAAPLPSVPPDYDSQLGALLSARTQPAGSRATRWRRREGRRLPVGIKEADPVTGLLATDSGA